MDHVPDDGSIFDYSRNAGGFSWADSPWFADSRPFEEDFDQASPQHTIYAEPYSYPWPATLDLSRPRTIPAVFDTQASTPCQTPLSTSPFGSGSNFSTLYDEDLWRIEAPSPPSGNTEVGSLPSVVFSTKTGRPKIEHRCAVCHRQFSSASDLERHGKQMSHNPYQCKYCNTSYLRRDVYLRHKNKHKGGSHTCSWCRKTWVRKDHLSQHMKTCRVLATELCERDSRSSSVSTCFTAGSEISRHSEQTWSDADSVCSSAWSVSSGSLTKQQMRKATRALGDVLGNRYAGLIDSLSSSLDSADDSTMKMFAERMVSAAVLQAPLPSASSK